MELKQMKRRIVDAIKDLEVSDYHDICIMIKSGTMDTSFIAETPRGTHIDLDRVDESILRQLDNMISTKLQRIAER